MRQKILHVLACAAALMSLVRSAQAQGPFTVTASMEQHDGAPLVRVSFGVPEKHFLYADQLRISAANAQLSPVDVAQPELELDKFSGEQKRVYTKPFQLTYRVASTATVINLEIGFQGCNDSICFFPETRTLSLAVGSKSIGPASVGVRNVVDGSPAPSADWQSLVGRFRVTAREAGYMRKEAFLAFLDKGLAARGNGEQPVDRMMRGGVLATIFLTILGGLGLNLTPCVLPLIPINLAIIGAGAKASSRGHGFALGSLYGLGMAGAYGVLGLVVVLTGAKFGTLNSSPVFNLAIALIFVVLGLAMFDVVSIDLTRFQGRVGSGKKAGIGQYVLALTMGVVAALLAGACVAPVVISVLLLAGSLYAKGISSGLILPFLLGLGMALPWPFAGAGLSFLPKPGKWMTGVKYGFGILILAMAAYYGHISLDLFRSRKSAGMTTGKSEATSLPNAQFAASLHRALKEGKPVFVDFWATWCKNCLVMDRTTFKDQDVQRRLAEFVSVRYQAELPNELPAKEVLERFGAIGLPTYVVLVPANQAAASP